MLTMADKHRFINDSTFFDKHPDIYPDVTRYEYTDEKGHIIETWERGEDGYMHETTKRDRLREEIIAAQEALNKLEDKNDD